MMTCQLRGTGATVAQPAQAQQALEAVLRRQQPWGGSVGADSLHGAVTTHVCCSTEVQLRSRSQCRHLSPQRARPYMLCRYAWDVSRRARACRS